MTLTYIISGFVVGNLVGLAKGTDSSLMTALLTLLSAVFFAIFSVVAMGANLAFTSFTKATGTFTQLLLGFIKWPVVRLLCHSDLTAASAHLLPTLHQKNSMRNLCGNTQLDSL